MHYGEAWAWVGETEPQMLKLDNAERKMMSGSLLALAIASGALAAALGVVALSHMINTPALCASPMQHCFACYGTLASGVVALTTGCTAATLMRPWARLSYISG